jgi:hypothetical protein
MSFRLIEPVPAEFSKAADFDTFFSDIDARKIRKTAEEIEKSAASPPCATCKTNLFFGFFFDGTKNNYIQADAGKNHSNVARLYDCFPGLSTPTVLPAVTDWAHEKAAYSHFFKVYIPGVASPFEQIGDSGAGLQLTRGAAAGYGGEGRILWALLQAINNIHRYFLKKPLLSPDETRSILNRIVLDRARRRLMQPRRRFEAEMPNDEQNEKTRLEFEKILKRLHAAIAVHMPDKYGNARQKDPATVKKIFISIFGFSRGATQARAFLNWLMSMCTLDARMCKKEGVMTLGGFEVAFNFLGLFDTVASVGLGNTLGNSLMGKMFDGHGGWADTDDSLRIPQGIPCLHLVAAHELRRSFPLDSISVKQVLPPNCDEVVVPGVHSDLGCGYMPGEQGRGLDRMGGDMLSRIPLIYMYRAARLAGVPLKLEFANDVAKERFKVAPETITALNAYLATCKVKTGTLTAIMREQGKNHILWHRSRRATSKTPLESTASFSRASNFDKNDLHSANLEFEQEIQVFEKWMAEKGKGFKPQAQEPGFDNDHDNEWEEIATWWNSAPPLGAETLNFFDNYVHDSRAWFKLIPGNPDNEGDLIEKLKAMNAKRKRVEQFNIREAKDHEERQKMMARAYGMKSTTGLQQFTPVKDGLDDAQRKAAEEFERTGKIPRMKTEGREPFDSSWSSYGLSGKAGYLRYRKVYSGYDSVLISSNRQPTEEAIA